MSKTATKAAKYTARTFGRQVGLASLLHGPRSAAHTSNPAPAAAWRNTQVGRFSANDRRVALQVDLAASTVTQSSARTGRFSEKDATRDRRVAVRHQDRASRLSEKGSTRDRRVAVRHQDRASRLSEKGSTCDRRVAVRHQDRVSRLSEKGSTCDRRAAVRHQDRPSRLSEKGSTCDRRDRSKRIAEKYRPTIESPVAFRIGGETRRKLGIELPIMLRYWTAGESHGKALTAIIDGFPAGVTIDATQIDNELRRRQGGYGRGGRQRIETDCVEILSGIWNGCSIGSPICLQVVNRDAKLERMEDLDRPRPGHGDLAGALKYLGPIRSVLERASARETAVRVAAGALARQLLEAFAIRACGYVVELGAIRLRTPSVPYCAADQAA